MFRDVIILLLLLVLAGPASAVDTLQVTTPDPVLADCRGNGRIHDGDI